MANAGASSSSRLESILEEEYDLIDGSESGWVEARTSCDHLGSLAADLTHIPTSETPCNRFGSRRNACEIYIWKKPLQDSRIHLDITCQHPSENWLCLSCKDVLCSRFVNKHMLQHYQQTSHSVALSFSDLSVWCFSCDAYLDAQVIPQLRAVHEIAYILKFREAPPLRTVNNPPRGGNQAENSSSES